MVRLKFFITLAYQVLDRTSDFVFNIQPACTERQQVLEETLTISQQLTPHILMHPEEGSRFLRLQANNGPLQVDYQGCVEIDHYRHDPSTLYEMPVHEIPLDVLMYVYPSRYCPSDKLSALANYEFGAMQPGYYRVLAIQQWVKQRTKYLIGSSESTTSALETLIDHAGVCRDFAHLMIALCRALNMPARFVSGINYGADPSVGPIDFHAYVEVMLSGRWYLFDPSEVSPPMGLLRLGTGRDAADIPFVTVFGNVVSEIPLISIEAIVDADLGLELPTGQSMALSSSNRHVNSFQEFSN
tara:strand:- start:30641 stop:31537 length:897 start_codon:yes stop_codon:yes gene_type:complete